MVAVEIKITNGPTFARTLKFIKESREARYNPALQTWTVPTTHRILGNGVNRSQYRFEVVSQTATQQPGRCPHYTVDQGCPMHGEYCREV